MKYLVTGLRWLAVLLILWGSVLMIRLSVPYTAFYRYTDFLMSKQLVYANHYWRISFYVHVFLSSFVLLTGLLQFSKWMLLHRARWHRMCGKVYAVIVLFFSGPAGLVMGCYANAGFWARLSFVILALLWLFFTAMAWFKIIKGNWAAHAAFMLYSYALTLSALTLRFYALMVGVLHIPIHPKPAYIAISWLSWTLNLFIAFLLVRYKFLQRYAPVERTAVKS